MGGIWVCVGVAGYGLLLAWLCQARWLMGGEDE